MPLAPTQAEPTPDWGLCTPTRAGPVKGRQVALRYALGDVHQGELIRPRMTKRPVDEASSTPPLFEP
jgi:hypothetical protein